MKVKNITILLFIKTFHNFTLRIQTGGARRVLKPNGTCLTDNLNLRKIPQPMESSS